MQSRRIAGLLASLLLLATAAFGRTDPAQICDAAAQRIAGETDVPIRVLQAITRTETGRGKSGALHPWPWTVNMEGKGVWFDTEDEARAYVSRHFNNGARSFDVGCFQINYRWHGQAFSSIEEMFDPIVNTRYAAKFLSELFAELGDWTAAAGAYHSRTREFADKYKARFTRIREGLTDQPAPMAQLAVSGPRVNSYSLLTGSGTPPSRGSLVPLLSTGRSLFAPREGG